MLQCIIIQANFKQLFSAENKSQPQQEEIMHAGFVLVRQSAADQSGEKKRAGLLRTQL
jgi:hypothetical protein